MGGIIAAPIEYDRVTDLLDDYFLRLREYNRSLGAFDMTAEELRDAREREALSFRRVQRAKQKLVEAGIPI